MSTTALIRKEIEGIERGKPFSNDRFLHLAPASAVNRSLSRLVAEEKLVRAYRGIYARPTSSWLVEVGYPGTLDVVAEIVRRSGETIQPNGGDAANFFDLSTQLPLIDVFHTDGPSRYVKIYKGYVKFIHAKDRRLLQFAGTKPGLAISALWYMGPKYVDAKMVSKIREKITPDEFATLKGADLPNWMRRAVNASVSHSYA